MVVDAKKQYLASCREEQMALGSDVKRRRAEQMTYFDGVLDTAMVETAAYCLESRP